MRLIQQIWLPY